MSKQKIVIRPVTPLGFESLLSGAYPFRGVFRKLTNNFDVITDKRLPSGDPDLTGKKDYVFNRTVTEVTLEYDDEKAQDRQSNDFLVKNAVDVFFSHHPNVLIDGKPHDNTPATHKPEFVLEVITERVAKQVSSLKEKNTVFLRVSEMTEQTKINVMDYFGYSPEGKNDNDLLVFLVDFQTGALMKDDKKLKKFLEVWMNKNVSHETELAINIRKAVRLGIISKQPNGNREDFHYGNTHIGTSVEDCINWFRKNPDQYDNHMVRTLADKAGVEPEVVASGTVTLPVQKPTRPSSKKKPADLNELVELRGKVNTLKAEGFIHNKIYNPTMVNKMTDAVKLKALIEEGEANKKIGNSFMEKRPVADEKGGLK